MTAELSSAILQKLLIFLLVHSAFAIIALWKKFKDGSIEFAAQHGDGVRYATVMDILGICLLVPEVALLVEFLNFIGMKVNKAFANHYEE